MHYIQRGYSPTQPRSSSVLLYRLVFGMENVDITKLMADDIVVAVMGPTGSGKSTLIEALAPTPRLERRPNDGLTTRDIRAVRVLHHVEFGNRLVLVETPGFDDRERSDMETLALIGNWLKRTYEGSIKLAGILYLHRIDIHMVGSPLRNLRMFGELCGDKAAHKVVFVTTMWDKIDPVVGERRQSELEYKYLCELLKRGGTVMRFNNSYRSAWEIMDVIFNESDREAVLIQEELVDVKKRLNETSAGRALYRTLQGLLAEQKAAVRELTRLAEKQDNKRLAAEMRLEYKRMQAEFERSFGAVSALRISLGRRLVLFFSKKTRARSLNLVG